MIGVVSNIGLNLNTGWVLRFGSTWNIGVAHRISAIGSCARRGSVRRRRTCYYHSRRGACLPCCCLYKLGSVLVWDVDKPLPFTALKTHHKSVCYILCKVHYLHRSSAGESFQRGSSQIVVLMATISRVPHRNLR